MVQSAEVPPRTTRRSAPDLCTMVAKNVVQYIKIAAEEASGRTVLLAPATCSTLWRCL